MSLATLTLSLLTVTIVLSKNTSSSLPNSLEDIQYIIEEDEIPEKINKTQTLAPFTQNLKTKVKKNGGVLCAFSEDALKESPSLAIYCALLAIAWIFFMIALCFRNIKQTIEKLSGLIHEFRGNRENNDVFEGGTETLPRLRPIRQTSTSI